MGYGIQEDEEGEPVDEMTPESKEELGDDPELTPQPWPVFVHCHGPLRLSPGRAEAAPSRVAAMIEMDVYMMLCWDVVIAAI